MTREKLEAILQALHELGPDSWEHDPDEDVYRLGDEAEFRLSSAGVAVTETATGKSRTVCRASDLSIIGAAIVVAWHQKRSTFF